MSNIVFDCISSVPLCKSHLETGIDTCFLFEFLSIMSTKRKSMKRIIFIILHVTYSTCQWYIWYGRDSMFYLRSKKFRIDRKYPIFIRLRILLFPISVILAEWWLSRTSSRSVFIENRKTQHRHYVRIGTIFQNEG